MFDSYALEPEDVADILMDRASGPTSLTVTMLSLERLAAVAMVLRKRGCFVTEDVASVRLTLTMASVLA